MISTCSRRDRTCVPHAVHFAARFSDVAAGPRTTSYTGSKADFSFGDVWSTYLSRVCRCGSTRAPTASGCSTTEIIPFVSRPHSLRATLIPPRSAVTSSPGWMIVSGGGFL